MQSVYCNCWIVLGIFICYHTLNWTFYQIEYSCNVSISNTLYSSHCGLLDVLFLELKLCLPKRGKKEKILDVLFRYYLFFRKLVWIPWINWSLHVTNPPWLYVTGVQDKSARVAALRAVFLRMHPLNFEVLKFLITHLHK